MLAISTSETKFIPLNIVVICIVIIHVWDIHLSTKFLYCFVYEIVTVQAGRFAGNDRRITPRQASIYRTMSSNILPTDCSIHHNFFSLQFRCSATRTQGHG